MAHMVKKTLLALLMTAGISQAAMAMNAPVNTPAPPSGFTFNPTQMLGMSLGNQIAVQNGFGSNPLVGNIIGALMNGAMSGSFDPSLLGQAVLGAVTSSLGQQMGIPFPTTPGSMPQFPGLTSSLTGTPTSIASTATNMNPFQMIVSKVMEQIGGMQSATPSTANNFGGATTTGTSTGLGTQTASNNFGGDTQTSSNSSSSNSSSSSSSDSSSGDDGEHAWTKSSNPVVKTTGTSTANSQYGTKDAKNGVAPDARFKNVKGWDVGYKAAYLKQIEKSTQLTDEEKESLKAEFKGSGSSLTS